MITVSQMYEMRANDEITVFEFEQMLYMSAILDRLQVLIEIINNLEQREPLDD